MRHVVVFSGSFLRSKGKPSGLHSNRPDVLPAGGGPERMLCAGESIFQGVGLRVCFCVRVGGCAVFLCFRGKVRKEKRKQVIRIAMMPMKAVVVKVHLKWIRLVITTLSP